MNTDLFSVFVSKKTPLGSEGVIFDLRHPQGQTLPAFTAGAHIGVKTPAGGMRQYSLTNDPKNNDVYQIGVKSEPSGRGGSISMAEALEEGDILQILPPKNSFELVQADRYLFIAGGIGITPILSMCRTLLSQGISDITLVYCSRDSASTFFLEDIQSMADNFEIIVHHDYADTAQVFDFWPLLETPDTRHIYCCGPKPLLEDILDMTGHWPEHQIHFEDFKPVEVTRADDEEFSVFLKRSNTRVQIPADKSILETLRAAGYDLRSSCESGTCGSCKTNLLAGNALHRDMVLSPKDRESSIMICVSRASNEELTLDL